MTWEIIVIVFIFVFTSVGQTYFTTWRMTSEGFLRTLFDKPTPVKESTEISNDSNLRIKNLQDKFLELSESVRNIESHLSKSEARLNMAAQGYEQLYTLIMRGSFIKIDQLIEQQFLEKRAAWAKREAEVVELAKKLEEYGRVILKK